MIFPMIRFLFLICFLCTFGSFPAVADSKTCIPSKHASLEGLTVRIPISEFRKRLVSNGWQPLDVPWQARPDRNVISGYLYDYIDQGYWEVVACSPTGLSYCKFHWTDVYQNLLAVITAFERREPDGVVDQYVAKFVFACDR